MQKYLGHQSIAELYEIKKIGTTEPVTCVLENGLECIAKYMYNPYGQQVLINELISSSIADAIGINVPEYGVAELSTVVIQNTNTNYSIDVKNAGPCFITKMYNNTVPLTKRFFRKATDVNIESLILFDHLIGNHDRHKANILITIDEKRSIYIIDHSHIWGKQLRLTKEIIAHEMEDEIILSKDILADNKEVYSDFIDVFGFDEYKLQEDAEKIKEVIDSAYLKIIKERIPDEWTNSIGNDILNDIFGMLAKKVNMIDKICEMIINERRHSI